MIIHKLFMQGLDSGAILTLEYYGEKGGRYMKENPKNRYLYWMLAGFGAISLSVVFFFILYRMQGIGTALDKVMDILSPFVYGGVMAYLLRPVCNYYEGLFQKILPKKLKKFANTVAVTLSLITGLLVIYALIIMIAPQLYESIRTIWNTLPDRVAQFTQWVTVRFGEDEEFLKFMNTAYQEMYSTLDAWARDTLVPYVTNIVSGVGASVWKVLLFLKNFLIGLIVAVYLLASRKRFKKQGVMLIRSGLKPRWADLVMDELAFVDRMFGGFIDGKIVDSAIIGVLCYIGCLIFKFPNALLVSAIVGITNLIPFFGPFIGAIPSVLLILIESPVKAIWFALFILVLQQLDGNVIGPKILGDRTGLSSFWVLFSIILFGGLWGLVGMVICVPLFAVIYDLLKKLIYRGLRKNQRLDIWDEYKQEFGEETPKPRSAEPEKKEEN